MKRWYQFDTKRDPRLASFASVVLAEFGITLVRVGELDAARRMLAHAEAALETSLSALRTPRCRRGATRSDVCAGPLR
jgi:hypothetical protein